MKRIILIFSMLLLAACGNEQVNEKKSENNGTKKREPTVERAKETEETKDPAEEALSRMDQEEKIEQLLYVGVDGTKLTPEDTEMIRNGVGGVLVLGGNVSDERQLKQLVNAIHQANEAPFPLFVGVDEEGGRVTRLPAPIPKFPAAAVVGAKNDERLAYDIGSGLATTTSHFGFNMDFAPVLDVNSNPGNPIIGDRALSSDPEAVARLGIAWMRGLAEADVVPVVKHFPGHGDTTVDSHVSLPKISKSRKQIEEMELVPFRKAISAGADVVMVAHILYPVLDPEKPSSLSKKIVGGLLRDDLGFDGVVITDDLAMGAISESYGTEEAALTSLLAGTDMVMFSNASSESRESLIHSIKESVENGELPASELDEKVLRIIRVKQKYDLTEAASTEAASTLVEQTEQLIGRTR
ncbi:beta-N-acetylhexosaminidase [Exiguobacterium flavidum]|uniref:beta-N-acetylhexosaminidase n=1 Tax=Exiguobacterium flavidum TaxID=2184695 RepID=UPI000DF76F87|nr:beta-N-acetylhexosaminidase [Exiguobacterium flavidum]